MRTNNSIKEKIWYLKQQQPIGTSAFVHTLWLHSGRNKSQRPLNLHCQHQHSDLHLRTIFSCYIFQPLHRLREPSVIFRAYRRGF